MGEAPPRPVQVRFVQKVQKELASPSDIREYAVSKLWVAALQQFIEDDTEQTQKVPPLSASDWDSDNMYVGEKSWRVLASWYGVDSSYSFRRRTTSCSYIGIPVGPSPAGGEPQSSGGYVLADNKLDFLTTYCCLLKDLSSECLKQPYVNIYFWESLDYVEFQLRCALTAHPEKDVRMWLSFCDDGVDVLLDDLSLYDRHSSSVGAVICEKYPEVLSELQKRQALPAPHLSHVIAGVTPVKEELSTVFVANQWQLTLCLEVLPPNVAVLPSTRSLHATTGSVPAVFHNLPLDHLFKSEPKSSDCDEELKQLLDESVSNFSQVISEQRDKVQARTVQLLKSAKASYQSLEQQCKMKMEEVARQETRLNAREKELNERDHEINSKLAKFKSMLTEFLTKKDRFEKEAALLAEQNSITASKVELNVGGVRYTTSLATMLKEEGSRLQTMFSGQHTLQPDSDGSYFIDRDGTHFRHILNFLRDGPASLQHLPPNDLRLVSELRTEAEYYQLNRMANALRIRMTESSGAKGDCLSLPS
ncbi:uncharacterized protein [Littorina saxatilis]|uniref:BTB domain-containing protein n=1 Tax=Littorina saxatilis TaxID=31220 RepID=A0AAN9BRE6_9CAEN